MDDEILIEEKRKLVTVTLNRPNQLNPFSVEILEALKQLFEGLKTNANVMAVLFKSSGEKAFSAGLDVNQMVKFPLEKKTEILELNDEVVRLMLECDKILITANNGFAIGMGMITNLISDFRLAVDDPKIFFQLPEINIGLYPATGALSLPFYHFPPGVATKIVMGGERLPLQEAQQLGFIHSTYSRDEFDKAVNKFLREVTRKTGQVLKFIKLAIIFRRKQMLKHLTMEKDFARACFSQDLDVDPFVKDMWRKWSA